MTFEIFKAKMNQILDDNSDEISENIGDCYYWECWSISRLENGNLKVGFDIGSGSGWIPTNIEYKEMTLEQLYGLFDAQKDLGEFDALSLIMNNYGGIDAPVIYEEKE
ncbi:hypothetical protein CN333_00165 [Bacillus thuringiensis]|uniref:Uncharacterized protein n=1 Tax=Bacillus cereus TaxID=1396 RepID=A0A9X0MCJ3_BACCE|nr:MULTISPECIES: hypothetical protein [Bacillus cereus group]KXY30073.1 hypothetical protein AT268_17350 [Bacillus cereus]MCC2383523.1 hypothetical protein [Bacillus cereus]PFE80043.1 hypothetical protein CN333_00165 [Bacillus thuringiensis]